jgi:hypothetical protein
MKVWMVGVSDCEGNRVVGLFATKELAEKALFQERDELVKDWEEMDKSVNKGKLKDSIYRNMIKALSGNDYDKWDNYPHEAPYLCEYEVEGEKNDNE